MSQKHSLSDQEIDSVHAAIRAAELKTSGEIRVFIDRRCKIDVMDRAAWVFKQLNMHKTKERNGVLFYIAFQDRKFAILGDKGIHEKVPENFWDNIRDEMRELLKNNRSGEALVSGIYKAGEQLSQHFPYRSDDKNELPDEIAFGE